MHIIRRNLENGRGGGGEGEGLKGLPGGLLVSENTHCCVTDFAEQFESFNFWFGSADATSRHRDALATATMLPYAEYVLQPMKQQLWPASSPTYVNNRQVLFPSYIRKVEKLSSSCSFAREI